MDPEGKRSRIILAIKKLRDLFYCETLLTGKSQLVEKLPINNFRLGLINTVFPDALFIHIIRNGIEVARSIERECRKGRWFGPNNYKWNQLVSYAQKVNRFRDLPQLCRTDYDRGLLEWRLSVETALDFYRSIPYNRYLQITYEDLLENPVSVLEQVEEFIGVQPSEKVHIYAERNIKRRSPRASASDVSESTKQIAGDLLERLGYL